MLYANAQNRFSLIFRMVDLLNSTAVACYPAETDVISLTVVADDSVDGEIWTTRLFGQPADVILAALDHSEAIDGILITKDGSLYCSKGLENRLQRKQLSQSRV